MTQIPPDHGGVTDTDLEAFLAQRLGPIGPDPAVPGQQRTTQQFQAGQGGPPPANVDETGTPSQQIETPPSYEPDDDEEDEEVEEVEADESGEPETTEPPPPPSGETPSAPAAPEGFVQVGDRWVQREQLEALLQFDALLAQDAELRSAVEQQLRRRDQGAAGASSPPVAPAAPTWEIPEEYADDPAYKQIAERFQQQQTVLEDQRRQLEQLNEIVQRQQADEAQARFARVSARFRDSHQLTEEQLQDLSNTAARLNVMEPLVRGTDPLTGQPVPRDPDMWIERALEIAYWSVPEYRDKEYGKKVQQRAKDQQRKQRLAGVGGSSGSVPRVTPIPERPHERLAAATRDLAEMMGRSEE